MDGLNGGTRSTAANSNNENTAVKAASLFKNNRNEMLYDVDPAAPVLDAKVVAVKTRLFTSSLRSIVTLPPAQSFAVNHTTFGKSAPDKAVMPEYWYEDMPNEAVLEDVTPTNVIQFVPRGPGRRGRN